MSLSSGVSLSNKDQLKQRRKEHIFDATDASLDEQKPCLKITQEAVIQKRIDRFISFVLTIWTCYIRLWKISQPTSVVFDVNELII